MQIRANETWQDLRESSLNFSENLKTKSFKGFIKIFNLDQKQLFKKKIYKSLIISHICTVMKIQADSLNI